MLPADLEGRGEAPTPCSWHGRESLVFSPARVCSGTALRCYLLDPTMNPCAMPYQSVLERITFRTVAQTLVTRRCCADTAPRRSFGGMCFADRARETVNSQDLEGESFAPRGHYEK